MAFYSIRYSNGIVHIRNTEYFKSIFRITSTDEKASKVRNVGTERVNVSYFNHLITKMHEAQGFTGLSALY